jgi:hypothetical protein
MKRNSQIPALQEDAVKLSAIEKALGLECLVPPREDWEIRSGFASDVLSEVLARAPRRCLLITVQNNLNAVAVAAYTDIAAILITSGRRPIEEVLLRAREEGIALYSTPAQTFDAIVDLSRLGIRGGRLDSSDREPAGIADRG